MAIAGRTKEMHDNSYGAADATGGAKNGAANAVERQFVIFSIGNEEYGAPITSVREIRGWRTPTSIPNAPKYVRGVINLRGNIVPVFDLKARFGGEATVTTDRHVVIMALVEGRIVGVLVDAISDILMIEEGKIQPPPDVELSVDAQCIDGLVAENDRMIALVNIHRIIGKDDLRSIEESAPAKTE